MWYAHLIGYSFTVLCSFLLIRNVVATLWDCIAPTGSQNPQIRPDPWQPEALALVESVLYVAFFQGGLGLMIGVWLGLKVAGHWKRWGESGDEKIQKPAGPSVFNIFLIGNGIAVLYSFVGFKLIGWVTAGRALRACWVSFLMVALTLLFWSWLRGFRKSHSQ